jgi:cytochrome b561
MIQAGTANPGYDTIAKSLHWVIAVVVLAMLIFARQLDDMADAERVEMIKFHSGLGTSVLILMVLRLLWRLRHPPPAPPSAMARWQRRAAVSVHGAFYLLLIAQPVLGMLVAGSVDYAVSPFGAFELSSWMADDPDRADWLLFLHASNANLITLLALVHIGAALWHRYHDKDNVLSRMLPFAKS